MNKNLFKVIFNKKRGQMMAVAENTIREGKSTADSTAGSTAIMNSTIKIAGLPVLAWSILLGFGLCTLVIDSSRAGSIHADTSAPKNQQPTILQTANGTPQINIRTPTKGGVSINQFRQMDVDNKGAILNNSRKNTETRLAGWIQANPWLSKGEARVIVNQINSTNPSQLNGYIEVAGRRAEVIIANPAGINVNGSGFINAAGVTLTTGKPLIKNGNLDGFEVRQGNISIGGDGLDTGSSEYTRILSQAAQINAGIWANNLNITAGSNNTDAQGNITESVLTSAENKPLVAIDAGKLGGMYAGKIVLVSTDKGVGVNNAGQIYAGNGNLSIDANGYLSNSGSIVVSDQKSSGADIASVSLNADRVTNSGTVSSQGKMLVHSEQLENSGLLTTADEINIRQQKLHNQGEINAGRIDIIADNIHNQNGKIIQTGTQGLALDMNKLDNRNNGLIGYAPEKDKPAPSVPEHKPEPVEPVTPPTTAAGSGQTVSAVNTHKTQFETGQIIGNQEIINDNGQIIANGGIDLTSKTGLNNHGSLNLNKLTVSGEIFDNYQGKLSARQALINTNSIDNHQGEITTTELLSAKSGKLDNRKGKLQSVKNIDIDSAQLDNSDNGLIAAQEQLSIQSGNINNSLDGKIQSGASLKLNTNNLNNRQGSIDSNSLILKADIVDNSKGAIRTNQQLNAQIGSRLNNQGGEFGSGEDILLNSEGESRLSVDNSDGGKIIANKNAYLNTESIKNNNKGIISSENLNLKAALAENTAGGVIQAGKQLKAQIDEKLNNMGGNIASNEELLLNADGPSNLVLNNSANGKIQAGKGAVIHASTLDNSNDGSIDAGSIDLTADSVNNAAGAIRTNQQLKAQIGTSLNNQGGEFGSGGDVLLNSEGESHLAVDNSDGGKIIAGKDAYLNTESIKNNNKGIISSENLHLKASVSLNNSTNGVIQSGKEAVIQASTLDNSNNGSIDADSIDLTADSVNNAAGATRTNQQLKAQIGSSLNNQGGEFGSGGDVLLNSEGESHLAVDNSNGGKIIAGKDAYLNTESIKNNNKGIISSEKNLNLKAARVENKSEGIIQAGKQLKAQIDEKLDNTGGNIVSNEELLLNADGPGNLVLNNSANGQIQAGKGAVIQASTLDNSNNGSIDADSIDLTADSIDNTAGNIRANKQLNAQINQKLLNQYGQISSADNVNIHDQLHNTLEIDNTKNGKILAGNDLNLQAKKLDYASTDDAGIAAGHDASIDLTDDFNINGNISANAGLKLHSNGKIINNHNVIGDSVIIDASRIDNQAAGTIQSNKHTELNVQDSVINRGLINSNGLTLIQAGNLVDNVGTGRIYGDHVAIGTGSLLNREEITGNETKAAIIAARQQLDIGARDIVNKEQGYLLSEGDLAIGGKLDKQYHASGMADSLINSSARIEAKGNGNIAVNELRNLNNHFTLEEYLANPEQHIQQYLFPGQTEKWTEGVDGHFNERKIKKQHSEFYFNDGRPKARAEKTGITWWDFNRKTYKQRVSESSPGEIIIGGNLNISGNHWENNNSRILVGGSLTGADSLQLDNIESKGQQRVVDTGTVGGYKKGKSGWGIEHHIYKRQERGKINETTTTTIDLEQPVSIIQQHTEVDFKDNTIIGVNNNTSNIENAGSVHTGSTSIGSSNSKHTDTDNVTSNNSVKDNVNADNTDNHNMSANNQHVGDNKTDSANVPNVKTLTSLNNKLPNNSLYHIDPDNKGYLVETDPAFTNKNKWLSSNYLLEALGQDPEKIQKRLGDGYYEQRLINEQIDRLTGYRRLAGYDSDEDEYKALMDAGISMAKTMGLVPGVALSADQIARLTSDIVWMVSQTVTMPDGSQQTVLVPQVYLMVRDGDLNTAGALISADNISLHTNKDINNQGTVAGRRIVDLGAHNLSNSGLISGQNVLLNATDNIDINGGTVQAQNVLGMQAQRINVNTTTATHGDERNGGTVIDRVAGLYVTGSKDGILAVNSVDDLNFHGANIVNTATNGLTQLASSNGSVNLGTVQTASHSGYGELSDRNHLALDHKNESGTQIVADGNVSLNGNKVNIRQSDINSINGDINIYGKEGVNITEGRAKTDLDEAHYNKTKGILSTKKSIDKYQKHNDEAVGSTITGSNVSIGSEQDISIRGSNVIADNQTVLHAGRDIKIEAAENQYQEQEYHARKKSGLMKSGGSGIFIGSQKQTDDIAGNSLIHSGSNVGSLKGDTTIIAGNHYTQSGSTVASTEGNVAVVAKQINVLAAQDQYSTDYVHTMKQSGVTVSVNSSKGGSVKKAKDAIGRINKSKYDRVNALAVFNAGMDTYKAASDIISNPKKPKDVNVGITFGQQKSRLENHTEDKVASASRINAGGTVNLLATGAGKDSNINIIGSDVAGNKGTHLQADNQINLRAAEQSHNESSSNKSSGWNAGVSASLGSSGTSLGITGGVNLGKGGGEGQGTSNRNSHVGSSNSNTSLSSGGATNIIGAQVIGKGVSIDAAELNIASLQDKAEYQSKQQNVSGQINVDSNFIPTGSAGYSDNKIKADYASVTEQSGIIAGNNGYQIKVKGNTDLKGAIITSASAAEAEGKNSLITGSLTSSDIKNYSDYSGSSNGIDVSGSLNLNSPKKLTGSYSSGEGHDSGHDSSTTHSGINTKNIVITDEAAQQQNSDKTSAEAIAAIHTDTSSEDYADKADYLANNFDKEKVLNELNIQVEVNKEFRQNSHKLINSYIDSQQAELREKIKKETSEEKKTALYEEIYKLQYQRRLLDTVVDILTINPEKAITQNTLKSAADKIRKENLTNALKSPKTVVDKKTGEIKNNVSYDNVFFDGVDFGGVLNSKLLKVLYQLGIY